MIYPFTLERDDNGTLLVSFPDLPWVHTFGEDAADATRHAEEALLTAIEFLIKERRPVPFPSAMEATGAPVSAMVAIKVGLHNELLRRQMTRAELARRLHVHRPQVDRLFDIHHASTLGQLEKAAEVLDARFKIELVGA